MPNAMRSFSHFLILFAIVSTLGLGCSSPRPDSAAWEYISLKRLDYPGLNDAWFSPMYEFPYETMLGFLKERGWSLDTTTFGSEGPPGRNQIKTAIITLKREKRGFNHGLKPIPWTDDFADTGKLNRFIKQEDDRLAKSQVPTANEAARLAIIAMLKKPGLDAQESEHIAGLYPIGRDVADFAKAGDLVWVVHITRVTRAGEGAVEGVRGVVWVSTTTKNAKVLFPIDP